MTPSATAERLRSAVFFPLRAENQDAGCLEIEGKVSRSFYAPRTWAARRSIENNRRKQRQRNTADPRRSSVTPGARQITLRSAKIIPGTPALV